LEKQHACRYTKDRNQLRWDLCLLCFDRDNHFRTERIKTMPAEVQGRWSEILDGTTCLTSALTAEIGSGTLEIQPDLSCTLISGSASHYDSGTGATKKLAGVTAQFSCLGQEGQQRFSRTMVLGTYAIGKLTVLAVADVNLAWISSYSKCP
jgi:hypothetical protein